MLPGTFIAEVTMDHTHSRAFPVLNSAELGGLCSETDEQQRSIDYMSDKFRNSGYKCDEISLARENVMKLNRDTILSQSVNGVSPSPTNQMIFTVNRNQFMATRIKKIIREYQEDIDELVGTPTRLVVAERRNANIASLLFAKSSFSRC